jgi:hypothetical protein
LSIKPEIVNDKRTKSYETSIWNIDSDVEEEHYSDLDIENSLPSLVPLPLAAVNAGSVFCQALDRVPSLFD